MGVYKILEKLKVIAGARIEKTELSTVSADTTRRFFGKVDEMDNPILESRNGNIEETDILPTVNLVYELTETSNLRAAFSQTLARPNMREISPFASFGTPNEPTVLGNKDLERTLVQNYDLRYEVYPRPGELFALSAYYKNFQDPIIWLLTPKASTPEIQPANVDQAIVFGIEAEIRKTLDFISPGLENFQFGMNVSYIFSEVDKDQRELDALEIANRPNIKDTRPFQGQSPYIVNVRLSHNSEALGWENNISFNIFGERLAFVTGALDPDVYEKPRPSLNFVSNKRINDHFTVGFKALNLPI
jgi:TonB-dependent receptor